MLLRMTYGERLKLALELGGKTRDQLAQHLGITVQGVGNVILGGRGGDAAFSAPNHARAARFLEVDPYLLATGEGEPRPAFMLDREQLPIEAISHARKFAQLTEQQRDIWNALVDTAVRISQPNVPRPAMVDEFGGPKLVSSATTDEHVPFGHTSGNPLTPARHAAQIDQRRPLPKRAMKITSDAPSISPKRTQPKGGRST